LDMFVGTGATGAAAGFSCFGGCAGCSQVVHR